MFIDSLMILYRVLWFVIFFCLTFVIMGVPGGSDLSGGVPGEFWECSGGVPGCCWPVPDRPATLT